MIIEIPVRTHVKQFLLNPAVWGAEPVKARLNSPAGKIVSALLSQYPVEAPIPRKQMKDEILAELEDIPIPSDPLWQKGVTIKVKLMFPLLAEYVTDEGLLRLGYLLEEYFELGLQFFVMGRMDVLATEQGAVKRFYSKIKIDPES